MPCDEEDSERQYRCIENDLDDREVVSVRVIVMNRIDVESLSGVFLTWALKLDSIQIDVNWGQIA